MGVFDDAFRGSNFESAFSKTKTVADKLNKKGAKYLELSRKNIEYFDTKSKLSKVYAKYGELQYLAFIGEEIDKDKLLSLSNDIADYREKIKILKEELKESEEYNNTEELKKEAERFANDVKEASKEAKDVIVNQVNQAKDVIKSVQNVTNEDAQAEDVEVIEVTGEQVSSEDM